MTASDMVALQWADVPHIGDVESISPEDRSCLEEVRAVLARHGLLNKFGVALLHHHFPIDDSEVFVETIDPQARTLTATATPVSKLPGTSMIETMWRFGPAPGAVHIVMECQRGVPTHDISDPAPSPSPLPGPTRPGSPSAPDPGSPAPSPSPGQ